jgi:hypothetical protein
MDEHLLDSGDWFVFISCGALLLQFDTLTVGATMFTILRDSFRCDIIVRIRGDATGAVFASQASLSGQRITTPEEAATCRTFNQVVFLGSWVVVGICELR